jgi:uncharacterized protein YjdB
MMQEIKRHKTAVTVIAAVFLLSVAAIIYTLRQPVGVAAGQSNSTVSSHLNVTVNDIGRIQGKSNSSSSAASAQAILLSSAEDQLPYSPNVSSPADGNVGHDSFGSDKGNQQTVNPVKKIEVPASMTITVGESQGINVSLLPEDAIDKTVRWSSDNPGIASVDKTGMVTANRAGSCRVTVCLDHDSQVKAIIGITAKSE